MTDRDSDADPDSDSDRTHPVALPDELAGAGRDRRGAERLGADRLAATRELTAAGIDDPVLRESYLACRRRNAGAGRTYFLATRLLPPDRRAAVHALYAFARHTDDLVDDVSATPGVETRRLRFDSWVRRWHDGDTDHPLLPAIRDTVARYAIPEPDLEDFLTSMAMDLTTTGYATWADLGTYVHGSAAVIGLQLLPVFGTLPGLGELARPYAADLGVAFQLTNFIRDIGEDLRRGRVYLPEEDLAAFGLDRADLLAGVVDDRVRRLLAFEIARARELYRRAAPGIRLLSIESRDCVRTALRLYAFILDAVEAADYRVLDRRVAVGSVRRAGVAVPGLVRARRARRR